MIERETKEEVFMKSKIRQYREMLLMNGRTLVGFELVFKLLTVLIAVPLFSEAFKLIMKVTGYSYLTLENVASFILHPVTLLLLVVLMILMTAYTVFDIATVIIILDQSYQKKKIRIWEAAGMSVRKCRELLRLSSLPLAFLTLFLIPFLNLGMASGLISTIRIPEFISDHIVKDKVLLPLCMIAVLLLAVLLLRWFYSLHFFILEGESFQQARKRSSLLGAKKHIRDLAVLFVLQAVLFLAYVLFVLIGILLIVAVNAVLGRFLLIKSILASLIWLFIAVSAAIFMALSTPFSYAGISVLYYTHRQERGEKIHSLKLETSESARKKHRGLRLLFCGTTAVALALAARFTYGLYQGEYNLNIEYVRTTEVTAHRGASVNYPENTMSAFVGAKELGADWIELDVQQTKDGEIIVIHDTNFKRTTGLDRNTWELTYAEVCQLDAGSFFAPEFQRERIPLLSEVIAFAGENHIKLNIELKPTGHETDFEKSVVDIIREYDYAEECVVTSQVYRVLENIKSYDPQIRTVYVMSLAYGDITALEAADHFSVEAANVSKELVGRVHREGKELYAWTVNTKESIGRMAEMNVDNIITDNIALAKETIYAGKTSNLISEYIKMLQRIF